MVTADKCSMCGTREMVRAPHKEDSLLEFFMCPNCDSPTGKTPQNSYDGVGPKKNST